MTSQTLCALPFDDEDNSLRLTFVSGKVKETVPWPFPIGRVVWAQEHLQGARGQRGKPIGISIRIILEPLPVFMLCTSVREVLGRKPATITMADDTFTSTNLWKYTNFGQFSCFAFLVRGYQSRRRIIPSRVRFKDRHLGLWSSEHVLK